MKGAFLEVKLGLDDAFEAMRRYNEMELRAMRSQTLEPLDFRGYEDYGMSDDDVMMVDEPPVTRANDQVAILSDDDEDDAFMVEQPPVARARQANIGTSRDRPVALSPSPPSAAALSSGPRRAVRSKKPKPNTVQGTVLTDYDWMKANMSEQAIDSK